MKYRIIPIDDYAVVVDKTLKNPSKLIRGEAILFTFAKGEKEMWFYSETINYDMSVYNEKGVQATVKVCPTYKVVAIIDKDMRAEGIPMLVLSKFKVGKQYRYRGFYNGETHDEIVTIEAIHGREVSMSNNVGTIIEEDGTCICLFELSSQKDTAKQDKKWTDEDMKNCFEAGRNFQRRETSEYYEGKEHNCPNYPNCNEYLQSLQKKYPEYVELETEPDYSRVSEEDGSMWRASVDHKIVITDKQNNIIYGK